jgi:anti-sigma-K factor RskA
MTLHEEFVAQIPAFALGCLDPAEAEQLNGHLAGCQGCQEELRAYQQLTADLAHALPQVNPPARLKPALLKQVRTAAHLKQAETGSRTRRWWEWLRRPVSGWAVIGLAALLLLALANVLLWQQVSQLRALYGNTPLQVVALSGTSAAPDATGVIVISKNGEHGTLVVDRLPQLPTGQQYQLWLIKDGQRTDGGVFYVDPSGYGALWVGAPEPLIAYTGYGVTIEPEGGSPGPTGEKVLGGEH